jgi:excisionase family DNA binding protein
MEPKLASIGETASILSVSKDTVRRLISAGKLGHVRIAGRVLVKRSEITRLSTYGEGGKASRGLSASAVPAEAL